MCQLYSQLWRGSAHPAIVPPSVRMARTFEPELSALDSDVAEDVLELLDLHTSWETWDRLRTWQSLPVERSRQIVSGLVRQSLRRH